MPMMDGLHLCKRIKDEPAFRDIPVILILSLVIKENLNKDSSVGDDSQIKKSDGQKLINTVQQFLKDELKVKPNKQLQ